MSTQEKWARFLGRGRILGIFLLFGGAVLAFVPAASTFYKLQTESQRLVRPESPEGLQSLSLSLNQSQAKRILAAWGDLKVAPVIETDGQFIALYWLFLALFGTFAAAWAYLGVETPEGENKKRVWPWLHWVGLLAAVALLVGADIKENRGLLQLINGDLHALAVTRFFTQVKLTVLLLFSLGTLLAIGMGVRRTWRYLVSTGTLLAIGMGVRQTWRYLVSTGTLLAIGMGVRRTWRYLVSATQRSRDKTAPRMDSNSDASSTGGSFKNLVTLEYKQLLAVRSKTNIAADPEVRSEAAEEPWVNPSGETLVGLALSGGGIRSATFNLGLLQGLHRLDLLRHVDYLATVSGGGYVGGFWSKWLQQRSAERLPETETFPDELKESIEPTKQKKSMETTNDQDQPWTRVFESSEVRHLREFSKFLLPRAGLFDTESWGAAVEFLAALVPALLAALSVLGLSLVIWFMLTFYLACLNPFGGAVFLSLFTLAVLLGFEWWWRNDPTNDLAHSSLVRVVVTSIAAAIVAGGLFWSWSSIPYGYEGWWTLIGLTPTPKDKWILSPHLYEPSLVWGAVALSLLLLRFRGAFASPSVSRRVSLPTADRTTMRLLALAVLWAVVATFWHLGLNLQKLTGTLLAAAGAGGGLFVLLRNWIGALAQQPKAGIWDRIKPHVPMVLAYLTVALAWAGVSSTLSAWAGQDWFRWYEAAGAMALVTVAVLLVDPAEFGLHAVYRDRISRAYLGGARIGVKPSDNRAADLRPDDDIPLSSLPARPLHLVCCAANDLSSDPVGTLSRGARSAVLSRHGVAMRDAWEPRPELTLGSAMTASAAAFNSNMGAVSVQVGPAVAFLMSALNLRLGLWVGNPQHRPTWPRRLPGCLYYKEMFSLSSAAGAEIHLSDGGHFDNLGLYELVRRHCRYIIVSDCTADPDIAFDDFGRTARHIREDFGVEIDIDLNALKPGQDGLTRQYAVVGAIDYNWYDKGTLVYIKPGLTGREPPDILQYKARNSVFPHESTGDQFYEEAQWESYRRLGVQAASEVFKFVGQSPALPASASGEAAIEHAAQKIFATARQVWYPIPAGLAERIREMSDRFSLVENEVKRDASTSLLREIFPEVTLLGLPPHPPAWRTEKSELADLGCLLRIAEVMEDVILTCRLDTHWQHPLNVGWVNAFARWATAPTFLAWWPFIRPMYGPSLATFLKERFPRVGTAPEPDCPVAPLKNVSDEHRGLAMTWWHDRDHLPSLTDHAVYEYRVVIPGRDIEVELALVALMISDGTAMWTSEEFFVPPSLWGTGFGGHFLSALFNQLLKDGVNACEVTVKSPNRRASASHAQWEERRAFVDFYRRHGFRIVLERTDSTEAVLSRALRD